MGFGPAMTAIKTYCILSSFMAHLVETSFRQSVEEHGRLEEELSQSQKKLTDLQADVQKLHGYKSMLGGKLSMMAREDKESSAKIRSLEGDLWTAGDKLKAAEEELKKAEADIVPKSERIQSLRARLEECRLKSIINFDCGFITYVAKIPVLHPNLDLSRMDLNKIVENGHLVDASTEEDEMRKEMEQGHEDPSFDLGGDRQEPQTEGDNPSL